jgi:hypothetical protein
MDELKREQERKKEIIKQLGNLKDMRRGSVTEQYYNAKHKDGSVVRQGPYFLYSYKDKGRSISRRLSGSVEAERIREEIEEFRRFEELSSQLIDVSHRICDLKSQRDAVTDVERQEKKLRRRSRRKFSVRSRD